MWLYKYKIYGSFMINKDKERARKSRWYHKHKTSKASSETPSKLDVGHQYLSDKAIRLHALALLFNSISNIALSKLPAISTITFTDSSIRGHTDKLFSIEGNKGRLTGKSISLWAKEQQKPFFINKDSVTELELQALGILFDKAEVLSRRLGISLERNPEGELVAEIREEHIAYVNDQYAETVESGDTIKIKDPKDGKVRFEVDWSKDLPEAEFKHRKYSYKDSIKYAQHIKYIITDVWNVDIQAQANRQFLDNQIILSEALKEYGQKLNVHIPVLESLIAVNKETIAANKEARELLIELRKMLIKPTLIERIKKWLIG